MYKLASQDQLQNKKDNTKIPLLYGYLFLFSKFQNLIAKYCTNNNNEK